jgi:transcriptional regulator with XRE-family HTH domain
VALRARKPEIAAEEGDTLGAKLLRRRRELGLRRVDAAAIIGIDAKSLMWWERGIRLPADRFYPGLIGYLGYEPWPEPETLGERFAAERRRRGLSIDRAAALVGVDEETFRRWERGEWKPQKGSLPAISGFLRE